MTLSEYNFIVRAVERAADAMRELAAATESAPTADKTSRRLARHLRGGAATLDERALRMIAIYDSTARGFVREGLKSDPRREFFKSLRRDVPKA